MHNMLSDVILDTSSGLADAFPKEVRAQQQALGMAPDPVRKEWPKRG
jgi:hypothetical protein